MGEPLKKWYIFTEWIIRGLNVDISIISLFENPIIVLLILCIAWQNWNSTLVFRLRADNKIHLLMIKRYMTKSAALSLYYWEMSDFLLITPV